MKKLCPTVFLAVLESRSLLLLLAMSAIFLTRPRARAQPTAPSRPAGPDDQYVLGPDSQPKPGVPQGKTFDFNFDHSTIFPRTTRKITVYVPAEYRADRPACVYIGLDGLGFGVPVVFDNLIYRKEMPITIGIGVAPGTVFSWDSKTDPRFNRSLEFDGLNDNLARFLIEEILPEVERHRTPGGLPIRLSKDPNDRAAGGGSTGAIGAFTLAWQRPDSFRRVFTAIGTFVGMRGGDRYPVLVRKTEPKPIRIFMQDGSHDGLDPVLGELGDWWMSNQTMLRSLVFAGYQVNHVWGEGTHNGSHAASIFPDVMRWLWKGWPQPVVAGTTRNNFLKAVLAPNEPWQAVPGDYQSDGVVAADPRGQIVFLDSRARNTRFVGQDASIQEYPLIRGLYSGLAFGPDGRAYVADGSHQRIVVWSGERTSSTMAQGIQGQALVVTHRGFMYVTEPGTGDQPSGRVWLIRPTGEKILLDHGLNQPSGVALSPNGLWLAVAESHTHWGYSYRVSPDGTVTAKQRFYWFHVSDEADESEAGTWAMDRDGRLYASTEMGIQIFDRNGRSRAIIPAPGGAVTGLAFGGKDFDWLYVACSNHRLYRRRLAVAGAPAWSAPLTLPPGAAS